MVTIKDIASALNISFSTVSRALNGSREINPETKKKIVEEAKRLGYIPNRYAQHLVRNNSYTVGFMIPDISDMFFSKSAFGVEEVMSSNGYSVSYTSVNRDVKRICQYLTKAEEYRYNGVFITPDIWDERIVRQIDRMDIPVISLRRKPPSSLSQIPYVDSDNVKGAMEVVDYLVSLGHTHIGFIGFSSVTGVERYNGYERAMQKLNLPEYKIECISGNDANGRLVSGYKCAEELISANPQITAIFAADDQLAVGVLQYCSEHDIAVPNDFSVVGFDDRDISSLFCIQLSTQHQQLYQIGFQAAQMMLQMIKNRDSIPESKNLETLLKPRKTTGYCSRRAR